MPDKLDIMMREAGITGRPTKPGHIRKALQREKSHYLAHQTYLKKRSHHFGKQHDPWWKQRDDNLQSKQDAKLRQEELSQLQALAPLNGILARIFDKLLGGKVSHHLIIEYEKIIKKRAK